MGCRRKQRRRIQPRPGGTPRQSRLACHLSTGRPAAHGAPAKKVEGVRRPSRAGRPPRLVPSGAVRHGAGPVALVSSLCRSCHVSARLGGRCEQRPRRVWDSSARPRAPPVRLRRVAAATVTDGSGLPGGGGYRATLTRRPRGQCQYSSVQAGDAWWRAERRLRWAPGGGQQWVRKGSERSSAFDWTRCVGWWCQSRQNNIGIDQSFRVLS